MEDNLVVTNAENLKKIARPFIGSLFFVSLLREKRKNQLESITYSYAKIDI